MERGFFPLSSFFSRTSVKSGGMLLASECEDRIHIGIRMGRVWNMPRAPKRMDHGPGKRVRQLGNHRWENRGTLIPERENGGLRKLPDFFQAQRPLLGIAESES